MRDVLNIDLRKIVVPEGRMRPKIPHIFLLCIQKTY